MDPEKIFGIEGHVERRPASATIANVNTHSCETEADVRVRQTRILQALATRLSRGDQLLPADVMSRVAEELELRIDEEAVTAAWFEQGARPVNPWRGEMARASRRGRGRDVREIGILERAQGDLDKLDAITREEIAIEIDALAFDPLPRGSMALYGHQDDHIQLRIGMRRLLYKGEPHSVVVVTVTNE